MKLLLQFRTQVVLLLLATAALFWPGLGGDFLFDDYPNIVSNESVHATRVSGAALATAANAYDFEGGLHRPLVTMWFAVDYALGGGQPWLFKLNGLLVHVLNAFLVALLLRRVMALCPDLPASRPEGRWICVLLALLWAIHPLQVSSVLYVVQRMETLSLTFVLLSLQAYVAGRQRQMVGRRAWPILLSCLPLTGLALACKETALLMPVYALCLELTVLKFAARQAEVGRHWRWAYGISAALALSLFVFWALPRFASDQAYAIRDFTVTERLLTQCRVLVLYLGQILQPLPQQMTFYYDNYPLSRSWFDPPATAICACLLLTMIGSAFALRRLLPLYALGIFWFFSAHLLTSNVVAFEMVFEHRNYFALLGIVLAVYALVNHQLWRVRIAPMRALLVLLVIGLGALTLLRAATWGDPFLLAVDLVARNPDSPRARSDLASLYFGASHGDPQSPYFAKGLQEFEHAAALPGASPVPDQGLIVMLATGGHPIPDAMWNRLLDKMQTRPIGSQEMMTLNGLLSLADRVDALDHHRLAQVCAAVLDRSHQAAALYARCGMHALTKAKDEVLAERLLMEAVERSPSDSTLPADIARALSSAGHQRLSEAVSLKKTQVDLARAK